MRIANAVPARFLPLRESLSPLPRGEEVLRLTHLSEREWDEIAGRFPGLGTQAGRKAARARKVFRFLVGRALATTRHRPAWKGGAPNREPTLYLTAHLGDLRPLRYILRQQGIAVAHVLGPENLSRGEIAAEDREFDRRHPVDFPHFFSNDHPHRLRAALGRGSLIAVIDRVFKRHTPAPEAEGRFWAASFLGGFLQIDAHPLRLSSLAGVPARPIFLTAPGGRLTVSVGDPLPRDPAGALSRFADLMRASAEASPHDFDGFTHRWNPGRADGKREV
ncbi:MAG: hypothetical protein ACRD16_07190 [Thermoanaerobaculia bacterium]